VSRLREVWDALARSQMPPDRAFWMSLVFLVLGAAAVAWERITGDLGSTAPLAALMLAVFGIGELSGRTSHLVTARLVGIAIFVAVVWSWSAGAEASVVG
jgi:hypothetical protein